MKLRLIKFIKDFLLYTGLLRIFSPFNNIFQFVRNFNKLKQWINQVDKKDMLINDYYAPKRDYNKRFKLYEAVSAHYNLAVKELVYLEFGVASGQSFFWWLKQNNNSSSKFWGFDTFEGLPENWGGYKKGEMSHGLDELTHEDSRAGFVKGIFQDSLPEFLKENGQKISGKSKLIHMDADLFSSTIFSLSQLFPFLEKGDIILFDEFNVANHEFLAYKIFTEAFYVKLKLIGAQNNFYQCAFIVE